MDAQAQAAEFQSVFRDLKAEIAKLIIGQEPIIEQMLICLFVGGHALIEGVPGLGKTQMVKTLSRCLDLELSRIQFTPDLMPGDIIGTNMIVESDRGREFRFEKGPLFAQIVLADEINRATPKTQSALLEAMQESAVTVGGTHHPLKAPFFVLATQNPIEIEGTYALPEAQLDRFVFKLDVAYPSADELREIVSRTTTAETPDVKIISNGAQIEQLKRLVREVPLPAQVKDYVARLVLATQPNHASAPELVKRYVRYGASPRGGQALVLGGKAKAIVSERFNVSFSDVRAVAMPALNHRLILNFEGEAEGISSTDVLQEVLRSVPTASS